MIASKSAIARLTQPSQTGRTRDSHDQQPNGDEHREQRQLGAEERFAHRLSVTLRDFRTR
jgi:hypothetical protein